MRMLPTPLVYYICGPCQGALIILSSHFFPGVGIYEGVCVEGVDVEGGRVTGVRTNKGNISCEIFVNCAGQVRNFMRNVFWQQHVPNRQNLIMISYPTRNRPIPNFHYCMLK